MKRKVKSPVHHERRDEVVQPEKRTQIPLNMAQTTSEEIKVIVQYTPIELNVGSLRLNE